jgi:hypothetical protein
MNDLRDLVPHGSQGPVGGQRAQEDRQPQAAEREGTSRRAEQQPGRIRPASMRRSQGKPGLRLGEAVWLNN